MPRPSPAVLQHLPVSTRLRTFAGFSIAVGLAIGANQVWLQAHDHAWIRLTDELRERLVDSNEAEGYTTNQCEGAFGVPFGTSPGWIRVGGSANPHAPIVEVTGQILDPHDYIDFRQDDKVHSAHKTNAFVNYTDNPFNHFARDLNVFLTLDPEHRHRLSTGSFAEGDSNEHGNLEIEWERGGIPMYAFPAIGDRLQVWGTHIFDCGHGDTWISDVDDPDEYRTEIHSPFGWVIFRQTADADGVPTNGKEDQSPWRYYESTDLQGMPVSLPTTGLKSTLVQATVADAYFSTYGGNSVESVNGCDDEDDDVPCYDYTRRPELSKNEDIDSWEWHNPILDNDYTFVVPAPPQPAGSESDVQMIWEVEERCAEVPRDPTIPNKHDHPEALDEVEGIPPNTLYASDRPIGAATCNPAPDGAKPYVIDVDRSESAPFASWNTTRRPAIRFTLRAKTGRDGIDGTTDDPIYPSNDYLSFAYRVKVAWDYAPTAALRARSYRVDFDTLTVYNDGDECVEFAGTDADIDLDDGEWVMSLRVNEKTVHPVEGTVEDEVLDGDDMTEPFWEDGVINDARCADAGTGNQGREYEMGTKGADLLTFFVDALAGKPIEVWERTYDKDADSPDDLVQVERKHFDQPIGGTSEHEIGLSNTGLELAHTIDFSITDVTVATPGIGPLNVGSPQYGPNFDTLLQTRVSGATPILFQKPDGAAGFQWRVWLSSGPPGAWQYDFDDSDGLAVVMPNSDAGNYIVEWATVSTTGEDAVVSPRSRMELQLDNVPPVLALPGNFSVYANSTAGADVTYEATATDNLPGPVTVACLPPSDSVFPNGANAPLTTTVNCSATDAVLNASAGTFGVEVVSPHGYVKDYALLGVEWLNIGQDSKIGSGSVGVFNQSAGIAGFPGLEFRLGSTSAVSTAAKTAAHSVMLGADTIAGEVYSVTPLVAGANSIFVSKPACGSGPASLDKCAYVPLWPALPDVVAPASPGANQPVNGNVALAPGVYGNLVLKSNAVVALAAGAYSFASIEIGPNARIVYASPAPVVSVAGRVDLKNDASIRPLPGSAPHLRLYVTGADVDPNKTAVIASPKAIIGANVYVPNGTLAVGNNSSLSGAFIGRRVLLGSNVTVTKDSVFVQP